ncbi:hypothetical protein BST27_01100 [Mycobacterium intermedium]|uniref:Uncharacterized protein n=1 Tax=Mycobacterium intermedium TaxID=28445 RepID=A0A1E3SFZ3_MYCIE|nr:hypothetical protein BHQ20_10265 [Mycobacterium intermedium]ORB10481.1 hypothetical protein BST27_01100 [Mycobacterium intermedium]
MTFKRIDSKALVQAVVDGSAKWLQRKPFPPPRQRTRNSLQENVFVITASCATAYVFVTHQSEASAEPAGSAAAMVDATACAATTCLIRGWR